MWTVVLLASLVGQAGTEVNDRAFLKSLGETFDANRAKFVSGRIWFAMQDGQAKSVDDAVRGNLTDVYTADGFYAFRGANAIYRSVYPDAEMIATTTRISENQVMSRLQSGRWLTDGKVTLDDSLSATPEGVISGGNMIRSGTEDFYRTANAIPLCVGFPESFRIDFGALTRKILAGANGMTLGKVERDVDFEGVKTVKIEVKGSTGSSTIWVDPERGTIPIRSHDVMPGGTNDRRHGDIRQIPGLGWLPYERTIFSSGHVQRIRITKADFGAVPGETFRLEFPKPVPMFNSDKNLSYAAQKVWDLNRLPSANAAGTQRIAALPAATAPIMPGERDAPPSYGTYAMLGLVAVVCVGGIWTWRSRSNLAK